MIVVDTNVLAYLLLPGPKTSLAEALLLEQPRWTAPPLWRSEWRNVLSGYLRRELLLSFQDQPVTSELVLRLFRMWQGLWSPALPERAGIGGGAGQVL
ncbi:type II toxin-antitoxin system VapC family toxin [Cyanobium sp. L1E-Cus]|uniref:type II toxin-antitoxin system VapC family toxin n=1 Tax=Cyanobium sp. L1E-Cus TaxID=2823714 RepID=UPI0020CF5170|nr:hypothetical protein [Cyanobium sp. L1E-Cus]MCP9821885.1 hypothetical protein [Cyanobium sp. L1E-Cus]